MLNFFKKICNTNITSEKNKRGHIKIFKNLSEPKSILIEQHQTGST